jgi:ribose 1,5-bisphosphokinase
MKRSPGLLVYVVGPSGAGKDSLLEAARLHFTAGILPARYSSVRFARRYITRPAGAEHEDHIALTPEEFLARSQRGDFVMEWHRHGLDYGIGREILSFLEQGGMLVMNGSRAYASEAIARIAPLLIVEVTVRPEVLRHRLELRGRESRDTIEARLGQAALRMPDFPYHVRIDNSGSMETAQQAFIDLLGNTPEYPA